MGKSWRGKMCHDPDTGLWLKAEVRQTADAIAAQIRHSRFRRGILTRRDVRKTVLDAAGRPVAEVRVDGSGNSHHEWDDRIDAVARVDTVKLSAAAFAHQAQQAHKAFEPKDYSHLPPQLAQARQDFDEAKWSSMMNPSDVRLSKRYTHTKRRLTELNAAWEQHQREQQWQSPRQVSTG